MSENGRLRTQNSDTDQGEIEAEHNASRPRVSGKEPAKLEKYLQRQAQEEPESDSTGPQVGGKQLSGLKEFREQVENELRDDSTTSRPRVGGLRPRPANANGYESFSGSDGNADDSDSGEDLRRKQRITFTLMIIARKTNR